MTPELPREARQQAIAVIERWFRDTRDERIGNIAAAELLDLFLGEIAPAVYNQAVADAQERLLARVQELDIELHAEPLSTSARAGVARSPR
jgi:uncharacterized protein (DUF2164 family)